MKMELVHNGPRGEIPDHDVGLEAHVGLLTSGDLAATGRECDAGHVAVVTAQEGLRASNGVAHHHCGSKHLEKVFIVWMQE